MKHEASNLPIARILADLKRPEAYAHPTGAIHVAQTHGSCVFLTGDYVYKVKKPVDFGFLDYTTLERRHHFCAQEVALNRRLCPDIYLDVVPIVEQAGQLKVDIAGEPVEWAVRMRQMDEEAMLSSRLEAERVGFPEIERIARTLADFHFSSKQRHGSVRREMQSRA